MAKIYLLDKEVSELIAAGEVVDRPASIVKELVENAIDAGATGITVEIKGGGIGYIRVTDNGCGISPEDLPRAFLRHATSKLRTQQDLYSISTLGFRGEALASIAAMARLEITTKTPDAPEGAFCRMEGGGELYGPVPAGCPAGTTIVVRDVFYNTPARMKFLRRDVTEGNAVAHVVDKCALSHPGIAFKMVRDMQVKLQTSGSGDLLSAIAMVYGRELTEGMIPVDYMYEKRIYVSGYIAPPETSKANRTFQNFFINGRYVRSRTCSAALEEAFKNKMMTGRFPACVLDVVSDPSQVDANVHPAKTEVRFSDDKSVFNAVYFAVKSGLSAIHAPLGMGAGEAKPNPINPLTLHLDPQPPVQQVLRPLERQAPYESSFNKPLVFTSSTAFADLAQQHAATGSDKIQGLHYDIVSQGTIATAPLGKSALAPLGDATPEAKKEPEEPPAIKVIGELFTTYILLEQGNDLLLVDKHAAHEGILYEQIKRDAPRGFRQVLLDPVAVALDRSGYDALVQNFALLESLGFLAEDFGAGTVIIREVPLELGRADIRGMAEEIAQKLVEGKQGLDPSARDKLYYSIACKSAVRAGDRNSKEELAEIIQQLSKNPQVAHCPHGRPIVRRFSHHEIEKMFGRLG